MNIKILLFTLAILGILIGAFIAYRESVHVKFSNAAYHAILNEGVTVSDCKTEIKPLHKYTIYKSQAVFCVATVEKDSKLLESEIKRDTHYILDEEVTSKIEKVYCKESLHGMLCYVFQNGKYPEIQLNWLRIGI